MSNRRRKSRLHEEILVADRLHAPTTKRLREAEDEIVTLKAQLLATTIELVRARTALKATRTHASRRVHR